jgi:hypothetical protein
VKDTGTITPNNEQIKWKQGGTWTRAGAGGDASLHGGKEMVLKLNSDLASKGTFYTDSNGREMVKRQRDARGPSYPPYQVGEPVAGNHPSPRPNDHDRSSGLTEIYIRL